MRNLVFIILLGGITVLLLNCNTNSKAMTSEKNTVMGHLEKFDFDINALDKDGLIGPADGKVSVDFQFCFPKGEEYKAAILAIDPDMKILANNRPCSASQNVALGTTHKADHQEILRKISALDFVKKISRVWYE